MVTKDLFGPYDRYTILSGDLEVSVITLGATVTGLKYRGAERAVCYQNAEDAIAGHGFLCKGVGRYANRIGGAAFTLEGRRYELPPNEHLNQLHGGPNSVDKRVWDAEILSDSAVRFSIVSPDGDNGYPGTLKMTFTYSVVGSALRVDFGGETDRTTVYAPTVHPYFNLGGEESVLQARLWVNASGHLEVNDELIPSGKVLPCDGKFDFSEMRPVREDLDDCFVLSGEHASVSAGRTSLSCDSWRFVPIIPLIARKGKKDLPRSCDTCVILPVIYCACRQGENRLHRKNELLYERRK